jgi:transposase
MIAGFDSLSASKRLREAGMEERVADAVVELVQQTARMPDISSLATKDDLRELATKTELQETRFELKNDIFQLKAEMAQLETRLSEKIRLRGWALMGGMAALMAIYTALNKLVL